MSKVHQILRGFRKPKTSRFWKLLYVIWNLKSVKCPAFISENPVPLYSEIIWPLQVGPKKGSLQIHFPVLKSQFPFSFPHLQSPGQWLNESFLHLVFLLVKIYNFPLFCVTKGKSISILPISLGTPSDDIMVIKAFEMLLILLNLVTWSFNNSSKVIWTKAFLLNMGLSHFHGLSYEKLIYNNVICH